MITIKKNIKEFLNIIKIINNISIDTNLIFNSDGIFVQAIHPSNHCFATFNMNNKMFEEYDVKEEIVYTVSVDMLNKILKKVAKKEFIIDFNEEGLIIKNDKNQFSLKCFVSERDVKDTPQVKTTSAWSISSTEFFDNLEDLLNFSDCCEFKGNKIFEVETKSTLVKGNIKIDAKKIESDNCFCFYDLASLVLIKDIKSIFDDIRVGFSKEQPCVIRASNEHLSFEWFLAARVE